jgi:ribosomal protein L37AE/L43A
MPYRELAPARVAARSRHKYKEATMAECPHCGESFNKLKNGKIPTHDFPKPCRQVCRGSGLDPRDGDAPLYKDDPAQEGRDFFDRARMELLVYGFAVVKQMALFAGDGSGKTECPLCGKQVKYRIATSNGHCAAKCETENCISAME